MQRIRNIFFPVICIIAGAFLVFCLYYLFHSREALLEDYLSVNPCFYGAARFPLRFSPAVKQQGNLLCILAILILPLLCYTVYRNGNKWRFPRFPFVRRSARIALLVLLAIGGSMAWWNIRHLPVSTDEVFSAIHFAGAPFSRLCTWYSLPNHHIGFNLLNHIAGIAGRDYVLSGRVLAALCYCLLVAGSFLFIYHKTRDTWLSLVAALVISLQFMLWGFGSQARGYALFYLLEFIAFVAFYRYCRDGFKGHSQLLLLLCCNAAGMWAIPSFAYCIVFQVLAAAGLFVYRRRFPPAFVKMLLYTAVLVFLLYLPVFCYSGIAAVAGNKYVSGAGQGHIPVLSSWLQVLHDVVLPASWGIPASWFWLNILFAAAPVFLWYFGRRRLPAYTALLVYLYVCLWVSAFVVVLLQRQVPVIRTLGGHMQLSLLIILLLLAEWIILSHRRRIAIAVYTLAGMLWIGAFIRYNTQHRYTDLYGQDTRGQHRWLQQLKVPATGTVWLADECFMWSYILKDRQTPVATGNCLLQQQVLLIISEDDEPLPAPVKASYHILGQSGPYTLLERNTGM